MRVRSTLLAVLVVAGSAVVPAAGAEASCADGDAGGSWPSLNHDLRNTRHQPDEDTIGTGNVGDLAPAWTFDAASAPGPGGEPLGAGAGAFQSTPVVSDGCLYVASSTGWVFALNADTGELVWRTHVPAAVGDAEEPSNAESLLGLAVANGRVYAHYFPRPLDFWAVALKQRDGSKDWVTPLDTPEGLEPGDGEVVHASPVVHGKVMFVPISRGVGETSAPPLFFLHAMSGEILEITIAVPEHERAQGYTGAGAWATAAVDEEADTLYVGTADSEGFRKEHRYNNAILKIDFDRKSKDFGRVLDAYKGNPETYADVPARDRNPVCNEFGGDPILPGTSPSSSTECLELDLDFGASPNLFEDAEGRLLVGALQKSGVYHGVFTDTMGESWRRVLSNPSNVGNAGTATVDGEQIVVAANPSSLHALEPQEGLSRWASTTGGDAIRYQPVTSANGVAYTMSITANLSAHDAATGVPLMLRSAADDVGEDRCMNLGGGVSLARNAVYAQCDSDTDGTGWVVAYDLGGGS